MLNVSDHIRVGARQPVAGWHAGCLQRLGLMIVDLVPVETRRLRQGANAKARVTGELVIRFK